MAITTKNSRLRVNFMGLLVILTMLNKADKNNRRGTGMPSKNEIKNINALRAKKGRQKEGLFVAEGEKLVAHLLAVLGKARYLFCLPDAPFKGAEVISLADMTRLSNLAHPSPVFAVFAQPQFTEAAFSTAFTLVLDGIRDPGNLGTILRLCDWFGVTQIVCTDDCVDAFNEKVVQASMGSVATVQVVSLSRDALIAQATQANVTLIGTAMDAPTVYAAQLPAKAALVIGNEGQGISAELAKACTLWVSIPAAPTAKAESLNAAMSAAILLAEFSRKAT
jgi:TrmH family RNA methyltransferase